MAKTHVGLKIRAQRKAKGLTLAQLHDATKIPVSTLSAKEGNGNFDETEIKVILKVLKISREELALT